MAEATLAVTGKPWARAPVSRVYDGAALVDGKAEEVAADHPRATRLVSNGVPLPGVEVTTERPGLVSEILVASPSLADGYYADPSAPPTASGTVGCSPATSGSWPTANCMSSAAPTT
ncbi:hypothetical protein NKH77_54015 [Streptomyces sp. M19]